VEMNTRAQNTVADNKTILPTLHQYCITIEQRVTVNSEQHCSSQSILPAKTIQQPLVKRFTF
jgi:hypothetical protein